MAKLKTTGIQQMMRVFGENCRVTIDDTCIDFKGIFDQENQLETVDGVSVILQGSVLTVPKNIAIRLARGMEIQVDDTTWYVREILRTDDGEIGRISITGDESQC